MTRLLGHPFSNGDANLEQFRWRKKVLDRLNAMQDIIEMLAPGSTTATAGTDVFPVIGGSGGYPITNTIGLVAGELVNLSEGGLVVRASKSGQFATHAVGSVSGTNAMLFTAWDWGPLLIDSGGSGLYVWLGIGGRASLTRATYDSLNPGEIVDQELGTRIGAATSGIVACKLNISAHTVRI